MIFKWFAETPIVEGYTRNCVYDLPRGDYSLISKEISEFIFDMEGVEKKNITLTQDEKNWINLFEEKEYCFYVPKKFSKLFLNIDFIHRSPATITNAIIDVDKGFRNFPFNILENGLCRHIIIRFLEHDDLNHIIEYLKENLIDLTFRSITVLICSEKFKKSETEKEDFFRKLRHKVNNITAINFLASVKTKNKFTPKFIVNIESYSESQNKNLYFNQKLYFTGTGNIMNSIECIEELGNIDTLNNCEDLKNLIEIKKQFLFWNISKSKTDICKDCEFRFMCLDNRIPVRRNENEYFHLNECTYNPYICKWSKDKGYLSLAECGVKSNEEGFAIDKEYLKEINKEIWND